MKWRRQVVGTARISAVLAEEEVSVKHPVQQIECGSLDFSDNRRIGKAFAVEQLFRFVAVAQ
jgi:hypothetical protein